MPPLTRSPAVGDPSNVKKLGRYECTEPLGGDGGFETYRGRLKGLTGLDRSFAVKVLRLKRSETASAVVEPFLQAAKRSAALANPRIATVVETGAGEGVAFAVTPLMEGLDLAHFLAAARQTGALGSGKEGQAGPWFSLISYVAAEIARGLHAAHTQTPPLIHGALCPGNVFITARGAIRLLDFGLRAAVRRPFEPRPRRLLPYIAPELASPAAEGTVAGDLYALGVLLCELSSGDPPPQGRRVGEIQILLSTLPEELGTIIARLLSANPEARPSAEETASLLTACHRGSDEAQLTTSLSSLIKQMGEAQAEVAPRPVPETAEPPPPVPFELEPEGAFELPSPHGSPGTPLAGLSDPSVPERDLVEDEFGQSETSFLPSSERPLVDDEFDAEADLSEFSLPAPVVEPKVGLGLKPLAVSPPPLPAPLTREQGNPPAPEVGTMQAFVLESEAAEPALLDLQAAADGVEFETPPAHWGARALAALSEQAGIAPGPEAAGLGLLDQVPNELENALSGPGAAFALAPQESPQSSPQEPSTGNPKPEAAGDSAVEAQFFNAYPQQEGALLEDQLVDAPEGMSQTPWAEDPAAIYDLDGGQAAPGPIAAPYVDAPSVEVAQVVASSFDEVASLPETEAFLEEAPAPAPAAAPAYYDDDGQPLSEAALPAVPAVPASSTVSLTPPSGAVAKSAALPTKTATEVPTWAKSPEVPKRESRRLFWVAAGAVLVTSIALGGVLGFVMGARGKPALTEDKPKPAPAIAKAKPPVASHEPDPLPAPVMPAAKPVVSGTPAALAVRAPEPAKPVVEAPSPKPAPLPSPQANKPGPPEPAQKQVASEAGPKRVPTRESQGVADAPGSGTLVNVSLTSQPEGATVWINGKERGRTPLQVKIQAGAARVLMILEGHALAAADLTASEGAKLAKHLTAIEPPLEGEARFRAECTTTGKLPIVIDGKETGVLCPFSKLRVEPGVHKIGLFVPALGTIHEKEITLRAGVRSIVFAD